jgi:hypothetical protein
LSPVGTPLSAYNAVPTGLIHLFNFTQASMSSLRLHFDLGYKRSTLWASNANTKKIYIELIP